MGSDTFFRRVANPIPRLTPFSRPPGTRRGLGPQAVLRQLADLLLVDCKIRQRWADDVQRIGSDPRKEGRARIIPDIAGCMATRAVCRAAKLPLEVRGNIQNRCVEKLLTANNRSSPGIPARLP